jgi:hypothetical protein
VDDIQLTCCSTRPRGKYQCVVCVFAVVVAFIFVCVFLVCLFVVGVVVFFVFHCLCVVVYRVYILPLWL